MFIIIIAASISERNLEISTITLKNSLSSKRSNAHTPMRKMNLQIQAFSLIFLLKPDYQNKIIERNISKINMANPYRINNKTETHFAGSLVSSGQPTLSLNAFPSSVGNTPWTISNVIGASK